jgi:hypothetical protein
VISDRAKQLAFDIACSCLHCGKGYGDYALDQDQAAELIQSALDAAVEKERGKLNQIEQLCRNTADTDIWAFALAKSVLRIIEGET